MDINVSGSYWNGVNSNKWKGMVRQVKKIAILGSTGSIGTQTLEIVRENPDLEVVALAAGNNVKLLEEQIREFKPRLVSLQSEEACEDLKARIADMQVEVVPGMEGLIRIAEMEESEVLVTAIVGMIGIRPTIAAIKKKKDRECLVLSCL